MVSGYRLVQLALVFERITQVAVRVGMVGLQLKGLAVGRHRFVELALVLERIAQVAVRVGVIGSQGDRFADQIDRPTGVALLIRDDAAEVQRHHVLGLSEQGILIQPLGVGQSPGLMV